MDWYKGFWSCFTSPTFSLFPFLFFNFPFFFKKILAPTILEADNTPWKLFISLVISEFHERLGWPFSSAKRSENSTVHANFFFFLNLHFDKWIQQSQNKWTLNTNFHLVNKRQVVLALASKSFEITSQGLYIYIYVCIYEIQGFLIQVQHRHEHGILLQN